MLRLVKDRHDPDLLLVDRSLIDMTAGHAVFSRHGVIVVTDEALCPEVLVALGKAGVRGAAHVADGSDALHRGACAVLAGGYWVSPALGGRSASSDLTSADNGAALVLAELTTREREVLDLVAQGTRNADIAAHLFITQNTVKYHVRNLLTKLAARDRAHLVALVHGSSRTIPAGRDNHLFA
jgi:DNA-binding NarL/FixJ family response regulator